MRVEEVPEYVTRFIEKDLRGRIVTTHPDGHCVSKSDRENMEPTPRTGNTVPGNQMSKDVGPRTNHSVGT